MEQLQIFIYAGGVTIALIWSWVIMARQVETIKALKTHVSILNKDHNDTSKENNELRELLEIQDKMIAEAMGVSIEKLN